MIVKTDKEGRELEFWPTIEIAAKAIKVSPKVLKGHINKSKPPKLGGFVFVEKPLVFKKATGTTNLSELQEEINYAELSEAFDNPELTSDEGGLFAPSDITLTDIQSVINAWAPQEKALELDEFGDPIIPPIPEAAQGHTGIPPELSESEITENDLKELALNSAKEAAVDPELLADYLRTPLQRRLYEIKKAGYDKDL